jgi:hypothetical protein
MRDQHCEVMPRQRDAALCRCEAWPGEVNEDGAAFALDPRPVVVTKDQHEIVEMIRALQALSASPRRQLAKPVVVGVGRIVAPAIIVADRARRELRPRPCHTIGAIIEPANRKTAERGSAVAFAFKRANAGTAECRRANGVSERDQAPLPMSGSPPDNDRPTALNRHDQLTLYQPREPRDRLVHGACPAYNSQDAQTSQGPR